MKTRVEQGSFKTKKAVSSDMWHLPHANWHLPHAN